MVRPVEVSNDSEKMGQYYPTRKIIHGDARVMCLREESCLLPRYLVVLRSAYDFDMVKIDWTSYRAIIVGCG